LEESNHHRQTEKLPENNMFSVSIMLHCENGMGMSRVILRVLRSMQSNCTLSSRPSLASSTKSMNPPLRLITHQHPYYRGMATSSSSTTTTTTDLLKDPTKIVAAASITGLLLFGIALKPPSSSRAHASSATEKAELGSGWDKFSSQAFKMTDDDDDDDEDEEKEEDVDEMNDYEEEEENNNKSGLERMGHVDECDLESMQRARESRPMPK
jgi:hypothetical protein